MNSADCLCRAAIDKFDEGDFAGALDLARAGLLRDESHAGLLQVYGLAAYHLAGVLARIGRPEEACATVRDVPAAAVGCVARLQRLQGAAEDAGDVELAVWFRDRLRDVLRRRYDAGGDCFDS